MLPRSPHERLPSRGIGADAVDGVDERVDRRGIDEHTASPAVQHLGDRARATRHDRHVLEHRFKEHEPQAFPHRGEAEHVEQRHQAGGVRLGAQEPDVRAAECARELLQFAPELSLADDQARDAGPEGHGANQELNVLLGRQAADEADDEIAVGEAEVAPRLRGGGRAPARRT